jgi:hypothetical protein
VATCVERTAMGRGIHAERTARYDLGAPLGQLLGQLAGSRQRMAAGRAGANDRHCQIGFSHRSADIQLARAVGE